jgi:ERCC4-related helicase
VGAKMLDEGIDIPDAEIGLNVSASKTKIQLIQRLGRILRKYGDKKPIFHHFVGIPSEMNFIDFEDPYWILDEVSWVMDTAMSMGVNVKIVEHKEVRKLMEMSENSIRKTYSRKLLQLPRYGVIKLDKILSQFKEESLNKLIKLLENLPENKQISNEEWAEMIRYVSSEEEQVTVRGYWWILILGNRNPVEIRNILVNYIRSG